MQQLNDLQKCFGVLVTKYEIVDAEPVLTLASANILSVARQLRDNSQFDYKMLIDLCGVDYSEYPGANFSSRFTVVYNLLSLSHKRRLRLKVFILENPPEIDSVIDVWPAANWHEREAFDMFGIFFRQHPDLRRILTVDIDGYPLRKDFNE